MYVLTLITGNGSCDWLDLAINVETRATRCLTSLDSCLIAWFKANKSSEVTGSPCWV